MKKKKKIGLFLEDSRVSGVSIYTKTLAEYINKNFNLQCEVILPKKNSYNLRKQLIEKKILYKFYDIERISKNTIFKYLNFFFLKRKKLLKFFEKNSYSIYIIQGSLQFLNIFILNYIKKNYTLIIHDTYINFIFKLILKFLVKKNSKIVFVSKRSKNFYKDVFTYNKKKIVPTGSKIIKIIHNRLRKKSFKIGTICNINPDKNIIFLLNVAKFLKEKNLNVTIEIAGSIYKSQKNYYKFLKKIINKDKLNNVKFLGYTENINNFLKDLDIYCCFSKNESSPIAVWEAMHTRLPIITTDIGDLKYHISKGKFGYLIENFDPMQFGLKINKILNNRNIFNKFSYASLSYSRKNFNLDKNFKKLLLFIFSNKNEIENKKIKLSTGNLNRGKP